VEFVDRPLRVLYIDGWPRWEYRYLKNLLLREGGMESSVMLLSADRDFAQEGTAPLARLPATMEEFQGFDVVIIGDVPGSFLDDNRQRILRELVARRGTGLLWIGGPRATPSTWRGTPLEDLLPFQEASELPRWDEPIVMQPSESATRAGLLQLGEGDEAWPDELGRSGASWARLEWAQRIDPRALKPTAETWATGTSASGGDSVARPLLLAMRFGAGTSTYVATDETWRWRNGQGETLPERFWIQIIRHLARQGLRDPSGSPSIEVDPGVAAIDQPVRVTIHGVGDVKLEQLLVEAELQETHEQTEIPLRPAGDGRYSAPWSPPREGRWILRPARGATWSASEASLVVRSEQPEQVDSTPDHALLTSLVTPTGGSVLRPGQVDQLPEWIPTRSVIVRQPIQRPLWDRWPLYAIVVGLLAMEWLGRRLLRLA
jgi:hypothetical protein